MKKVSLLALLLLPLLAFTYAEWQTFKLDERVTVSFPSAPTSKDVGGNTMWMQKVDSLGMCMAMVVDFSKFGADSATLAGELAKEETYAMFQNSMLAQMPGASLVSEKILTLSGRPAYEMVINTGKGGLNRAYVRNIFVGSKMYTLTFYEGDAKPQQFNREKFLNSYKIK